MTTSRPDRAVTAPAGTTRATHAGLHLLVLWAFAVAQPLFDLLGRYPTFFVAHGAGPRDVVSFSVLLVVAPPAALWLLELGLGTLSARARTALHLLLVGVLLAVVVLPPLHRAIDLPPLLALIAVSIAGLLGALAYWRLATVRTFLTALSPAAVIFPVLFLIQSPVAALLRQSSELASGPPPPIARPAPVVFVVFDELSVLALMDGERRIDAARYPSFAALAATATWYRNTTTVADYTPTAVPAILTGVLPDHSRLPAFGDHPHNLFTLLGGSYDLAIVESVTALCPPELCAARGAGDGGTPVPGLLADAGLILLHMAAPHQLRGALPDIQQQWTFQFNRWNFRRMLDATTGDRGAVFRRFVESIDARERPALFFLHILLPHSPYHYLPSGTRYSAPPWSFGRPHLDPHALGEQLDAPYWPADNHEGARVEQLRYLNQLAFVDRLLGLLLERLRATGVFDEALVVVTADHGVCHRAGHSSRYATAENLPDIMGIPLFIKTPQQRVGRIDDRPAETIDIVPTVADLLGAALPWPVDGRSLTGPRASVRTERVIFTPVGRSNLLDLNRLTAPAAMPERPEALTERLALFGAARSLDANAPTEALMPLLGRPVAAVPNTTSPRPFAVMLDKPDFFRRVDPASGVLPAFVSGHVQGDPPPAPGTPLAIAVNGIIAAVTEVLPDGTETPVFGTLVPEAFWHPGENQVEVFAVVADSPELGLAAPHPHDP